MASKKTEFKAGIVVILGLAVLALGLYLVSGGAEQFRDKKLLTVLFKNGGGIGGGDAVYLAGRKVGKVNSVNETRDETGTFVAVELEILRDASVHTDSRISVSQTVTGIVSLNIEFGESGELAPDGAKLKGEKLRNFEEAIDEGAKLLKDARSMLATVDKAVLQLDEHIRDLEIKSLREKIDKILDELLSGSKRLTAIIDDAGPEVDTILKDARAGANNFKTLTGDLVKDWTEISATLRTTLDGARRASEDLEAMLSENRPNLKAAIQNLADGTLRVGPVLEQIEKLAKAAESIVIDIGPKLSSGLRAAEVAFKNFKAVTEDLKTAPWKLVNEPSQEESDEVHLYNAARKFVDGAERIQEVLEELDALRRQGGLGDDKMKERLNALAERLEQSLKNYAKREKKLVDLLAKK